MDLEDQGLDTPFKLLEELNGRGIFLVKGLQTLIRLEQEDQVLEEVLVIFDSGEDSY